MVPPEPVFAGRSLSDYLVDLARPPGSGSYLAASNAVVEMGDVALPLIARSTETPVPWVARIYLNVSDKLPRRVDSMLFKFIDPHWYGNRSMGATEAIRILGSRAVSLAPLIIARYAEPGPISPNSVGALQGMGPAVLPYLEPWLTGTNLTRRADALMILAGVKGTNAAEHEAWFVRRLPGLVAHADEIVLGWLELELARPGELRRAATLEMLSSPIPLQRRVALKTVSHAAWATAEDKHRLTTLLADDDRGVRVATALIFSMGAGWRNSFGSGRHRALPASTEVAERCLAILNEELARNSGAPTTDLLLACFHLGRADDDFVRIVDATLQTASQTDVSWHLLRDLRLSLAVRRGEDARPWGGAPSFRALPPASVPLANMSGAVIF